MSQEKNNTKGKHLKEKDRYKIEVLLKEKMNPAKIAELLGKSKRTIEREIKRGLVVFLNSDLTEREEYCADAGQRVYEEKGSLKGRNLKIDKDHKLAEFLTEMIVGKNYSPYATLEEIKKRQLEFEQSICEKTLYNYIENEVFLDISTDDLPEKKKAKRKYKKRNIALNNTKGRSIEERPKEVENRQEYGHWEMDCVVGKKGSKECLLVLTERASRHEIIRKMKSKKSDCVISEINKLERKLGTKFYDEFKTITVDNGSEFLNMSGIEKSIRRKDFNRTIVYYAHPYSAYERGSNENANKLIRRFIQKGEDISKYTNKQIKEIESWMNNYPRRLFDGKSANEIRGILIA